MFYITPVIHITVENGLGVGCIGTVFPQSGRLCTRLRRHEGRGTNDITAASDAPGLLAALIEVLWRRRAMVGLAVLACLVLAGGYLLFATPIYSATAKVLVEQNGPLALNEAHGQSLLSDSFVQTQADVFQSAPVLSRAMDSIQYRELKTFAAAGNEPVAWLQHGNGFRIDVAKKSDVILVSMESPYPTEAAKIVNGVVDSYIAERSSRKQSTGLEMVRALEAEKQGLLRRRDAAMAAMQKYKRDNSVLSFGNDKANTALERTMTLSASLTTAEMATMELRRNWPRHRRPWPIHARFRRSSRRSNSRPRMPGTTNTMTFAAS